MLEHLPSKFEALSSSPHIDKNVFCANFHHLGYTFVISILMLMKMNISKSANEGYLELYENEFDL